MIAEIINGAVLLVLDVCGIVWSQMNTGHFHPPYKIQTVCCTYVSLKLNAVFCRFLVFCKCCHYLLFRLIRFSALEAMDSSLSVRESERG